MGLIAVYSITHSLALIQMGDDNGIGESSLRRGGGGGEGLKGEM